MFASHFLKKVILTWVGSTILKTTSNTFDQKYLYSHTECDRRLGGWGAKASEQLDQSNDLDPISAIDSARDPAEDLAIGSTIDLAKDSAIDSEIDSEIDLAKDSAIDPAINLAEE